jgi:hypothetical protein
VYNYSDFPGDPQKVLTQYFDVMFYIANWGSWQLMFRFPKGLVDPALCKPYCLQNAIAVSTTSKWMILDIQIHNEEGIQDWVEGEGWLSQLVPLRADLMQGDLRLLYLAWLRAVDSVNVKQDPNRLEPSIATRTERTRRRPKKTPEEISSSAGSPALYTKYERRDESQGVDELMP